MVRRVAFYSQHGYHVAVLAPVADAVGDRLTTLISTDSHEVVRFRPDIVVLAAFQRLQWFRRALPDALIGSVRHGLIAKRGLLRLPDRPGARRFDFVCFGESMTVDRYARAAAHPTEAWMTGYPQLDPLFRRDPPPDTGLDPGQPTVLYAQDTRVRLVDPRADVTKWMLGADVLVSDASSTMFEFLALDRPIVLVTNPRGDDGPQLRPGRLAVGVAGCWRGGRGGRGPCGCDCTRSARPGGSRCPTAGLC